MNAENFQGKLSVVLLTLLAALTSACSQTTPATVAATANNSAAEPRQPLSTQLDSQAIVALLASADRSEEDQARDARSKPAQVLAFLGIAPGMQVADLFTGGGYYSEAIAAVVGPQGRVFAHNNSPYAGFAGDAPATRFAPGRLPNLTYQVTEADNLKLPQQLDAIIMVMSFHDTYWVNPKQGWPKIDNALFNKQLYTALKPGGTLGIVDHAATLGSGIDAVSDLHRIDEDFVTKELEAAGFRLEETSDALRNDLDDRSAVVFDTSIRGQTDRFIFRFTKPE